MKTNVGSLDRVVRFLVGVVLVLLPFVGPFAIFEQVWATALSVVVGVVMLVVSATRICPVYSIFGWRTSKT